MALRREDRARGAPETARRRAVGLADALGHLPQRRPAAARGVLRILRPVADEIVVAIDDRAESAPGGRRDRARRPRVPRPLRRPAERTLQWLHEQTTGDWVFRIDDDEVPSRALLAALAAPPEDVTHCFVPRRCLWGTAGSTLPLGARVAAAARPARRARLPRADPRAVAADGAGALPRRAALAPRPGQVRPRDPGGEGRRYPAMPPGLRVAGREQNEAYFIPESRLAARRPVPAEDRELDRPRAPPAELELDLPRARDRDARADRRALGRPRALRPRPTAPAST